MLRRRERIDDVLGFMAKDLHDVPSAYSAEGSTGRIAGTIRQGTSTDETLAFMIGLKRRCGGSWPIARCARVIATNAPAYLR